MDEKEVNVRTRRKLDLATQHGTVEVTATSYGREPKESVRRIRVTQFTGPVARVAVEASVTRNLGNFNSMKVSARVELPCYPEATDLQQAHETASAIVAQIIESEVSAVTSDPNFNIGG